MTISLQTNPNGLIARQNFSGNVSFLSDSVRKLSSGLRINKAADDPNSISLARQFDSQALSLGQAAKNANDGISAMQVVDNSLSEAMSILDLLQSNALTATQDDQDTSRRRSLQSDSEKLLTELDQLLDATSYHDIPLLRGTYSNKAFQIGAVSGQSVSASLPAARLNQIGAVQTGEMRISSSVGGQVHLQLINQANFETISINSVTLSLSNDPNQGMGALASAINRHTENTGIAARAVVESQSGTAISAGTTPSTFALNGVPIGTVTVRSQDSDGRLVTAINGKTASHGVSASVTADGALLLSASDGRAIGVSGSLGTLGFSDAEMSTFGFTRILQDGQYNLNLTDSAEGLAVAFSPTMHLAAPVTTTVDSTLTKNSVLGSSTRLTAGWTAGADISGADLSASIITSETSTLGAGSILASGSILATASILGGTVTLTEASSTTASTLLRTGSIVASGSVINQGSYLTNAVNTTAGNLTAGQVLSSDVTLSGGLTLDRDMLLVAGSLLAAGSSLAASSQIGGDILLNGALTMSTEMTLALGSRIQDSDGVTLLTAGSSIGGEAQFAEATMTVQDAMLVKANSTLSANSQLGLGSTLGGAVVLAGNHTSILDLSLAAGSTLATGSLIKLGTTLSTGLMTTSGPLSAGTVTNGDVLTIGTNTLTLAMTLKQGSILANGSTLAANSSNETAVSLSQESALRLNDIRVLTKDEATIAVKVIEAARVNLETIRQQAAALSDQFAGFATVQGRAKQMMEGAKSKLLAVDFGEEAVNFTRMEMLIRTSSFALTQANAVPGSVFMIMQGGGANKANQFFITAMNRLITEGGVVA